jgi:hypothetical protein
MTLCDHVGLVARGRADGDLASPRGARSVSGQRAHERWLIRSPFRHRAVLSRARGRSSRLGRAVAAIRMRFRWLVGLFRV